MDNSTSIFDAMISKVGIINRLKQCKEELLRFGVSKVGLFGSVKRAEMGSTSDIDILIDFEDDKETYENYLTTCDIIENVFKEEKVDIVSLKGLSPFIGPYILREVEYV